MYTHAYILVDYVGSPSAEVCRTTTNSPQVDDVRFIELGEVEVKDVLSQAILQLRYKKSLVSPNTPNTTRICIGALVREEMIKYG